jgi:Resolvase, N terminal domain
MACVPESSDDVSRNGRLLTRKRSVGSTSTEGVRVASEVSRTARFCDSRYSPAAMPVSGCPELVSEINVAQPALSQGSATVRPWDICLAMPAIPGGKLVFHVFAALAEFERDLIRERTTAGLAAARARGRRGGRPSVLSGHKLQVAQEMYRSG